MKVTKRIAWNPSRAPVRERREWDSDPESVVGVAGGGVRQDEVGFALRRDCAQHTDSGCVRVWLLTRLGAFDFVEKPLSLQKLLRTVERALEAGKRKRHAGKLLAASPGVPVGRFDRLASQVDLLPTLLDLMGLDSEHPMIGRNLLQLAGDEPGHTFMQYDTTNAYRVGDRVGNARVLAITDSTVTLTQPSGQLVLRLRSVERPRLP